MKKAYISPQVELLPLSIEQSICDFSITQYTVISGELDGDSD